MTADQLTQMFPAACAGVGLFLAGGANLVLRGRRLHLRLLATAAGVAAALAAAASLDQPGAVAGTARLLALALLPAALLASPRAVGGVSALVRCLHRPAARHALLAVGGAGLALGSVARYERAEAAAAAAGLDDLEWMVRAPVVASQRAAATTDRGSRVNLMEPAEARDGVDWDAAEERTLRGAGLDGQVIRRGGGTEQSNCHGWVFTGGRFNLSPAAVEAILRENGYAEAYDPRPGDLVIYRQGGMISHTAVVRYVAEGQPVLVEGKWGPLGVFLHPADKSTYGTDYTFYRSPRRGHLLAGLGSPTPRPSPDV